MQIMLGRGNAWKSWFRLYSRGRDKAIVAHSLHTVKKGHSQANLVNCFNGDYGFVVDVSLKGWEDVLCSQRWLKRVGKHIEIPKGARFNFPILE